MTNQELGIFGEEIALQELRKKGYSIVEKNYKYGRNEVDLIARINNEIIFVEVKTRQTAQIGEPWRAVNRSKQKQILKVAHYYLQKNKIQEHARMDVISIVHNTTGTFLEHIENAFIAH